MATPEEAIAAASAPPGETEAQKRARARRDKILARGSDRLAKITSTGRGEEAGLWDTTSPAQRRAPSTSAASPVATSQASGDPDDVDLSTLPRAPAGMPANALQSFMQPSAFGDRFAGTDSPGPMPDMNDLFAQMLGGAAGGQPGQPGANPLLAQMMAGASGQQVPAAPARPRTWLDRLVPLVHLLTMLGLAVYAVVYLEPSRRLDSLSTERALSGAVGQDGSVGWTAWAALLGERKGKPIAERLWTSVMSGGLAEVPLFYLFVTAELVLQSAHIFLTRNAPPPPGMLSMILPYLPPPLPMYAATAFRYWALVGTLLDDFAVLVLFVGLLVLLSQWQSGA